jgi:hypothetical protein
MTLAIHSAMALILCLTLSGGTRAQESKRSLALVKDGRSDYRIVVAEAAAAQEKRAAEELRDFVKQISGATLSIVTDDQPVADKEIMLGPNRHLDSMGARLSFDKLGDEGFTIRTAGPHLIIAGGSARGTLYGVYTFLEDHLGCRWYTPTVSFVPSKWNIVLGEINDTQVPALAYREVYYAEAKERAFAVRQKLNGVVVSVQAGEAAPDGVLPGFNGWAHTLFILLPPDKYFGSNPEYFALRDGKRQPTQPCLTNPDVLRIVVENLRKAIEANPKGDYWSVSQMDNGEPCTCDRCKAIDDREGSPAGAVVEFVNKVAAHSPAKTISTLAYWYTMAPPKTVKPAKNVHIMFCMDVNHSPPYYGWFEGWSKIAPRMYIWYYVIPCHNFIAPWPNLHLLQPQIKDYVAHGTTGMFIEGGYNAGSEFAELRTYLLAKILWNPNCDAGALMDDFLQGYYGPAATPIRKYIDALRDSAKAAGAVLDGHTWCAHFAGSFLSPTLLARYDPLFDEAEKTVADNPELLLRVQHARMPLMHAELQLRYGDVDARLALAQKLRDYAVRSHTEFFADFNSRPTEQYLSQIMDDLQREKTAKP